MRVCQRQRRHLFESLREWLLVPPFTRAFLKSPSSRGLSAIAELLVDMRALWCLGLSARAPAGVKIRNGGLDQYGAEPFEQQQFAIADVEGVKLLNTRFDVSAEHTKVWATAAIERYQILCYSLFHCICEIHLPFKLGVSVTRGNSCKLVKTSRNTNATKYFYTNRIVLAWNSLSDTVVTASSVNAFRKQLNAVNLEKFLIVG